MDISASCGLVTELSCLPQVTQPSFSRENRLKCSGVLTTQGDQRRRVRVVCIYPPPVALLALLLASAVSQIGRSGPLEAL